MMPLLLQKPLWGQCGLKGEQVGQIEAHAPESPESKAAVVPRRNRIQTKAEAAMGRRGAISGRFHAKPQRLTTRETDGQPRRAQTSSLKKGAPENKQVSWARKDYPFTGGVM